MEKSRNVPLIAILYQKSVGGPSAAMQVKVEQSKGGQTKVTILKPLSMAGVTSVDNGRQWHTYLPDQNRMIVQESPRRNGQSVQGRLDLAEQNYVFKMEQDVTIAGRRAACISALPRVKNMPTRRYYVDKETAILLRLETVEGADTQVQFDTKLIQYPKETSKASFEMKFFGDKPRRIDCPAPTKIASANQAKPSLGFSPIIPVKLPMGFVVQEPQVAGGSEFRFAAIRLTDGLVNGTVYQWRGEKDDLPTAFKPQKGDKLAKGVWFRFVGDVPNDAKDQLLDLFLREAAKHLKMLSEPAAPPPALKGVRNDLMGTILLSIEMAAAEAQTSNAGMCGYSRGAATLEP